MAANQPEHIEIVLNGEARAVPGDLSVLGLLNHIGVVPDRVAVELDRSIVRKPDWPNTTIRPGAQVEVVQFVGGG
jgi:thiamine biosynthesis protein ThiS